MGGDEADGGEGRGDRIGKGGHGHQVTVKVFIGKFHNIEKLFQKIKILSRPCLVPNALSLLVFTEPM